MDAKLYTRETMEITDRLLFLADQEKVGDPDEGCLIVDGVLRDCAYKIRGALEGRQMRSNAQELGSGPAGKGAGRGRL